MADVEGKGIQACTIMQTVYLRRNGRVDPLTVLHHTGLYQQHLCRLMDTVSSASLPLPALYLLSILLCSGTFKLLLDCHICSGVLMTCEYELCWMGWGNILSLVCPPLSSSILCSRWLAPCCARCASGQRSWTSRRISCRR